MEMQFGDTRVVVLPVCELRADLVRWFGLEAWPGEYDGLLRRAVAVPVQCVLVQKPGMTLLVDAYEYDLPPNSAFALPDYEPPPGLVAQLAAVGVLPEEVTQVVITHLHFDHYTGVTREEGGVYVPMFPRARVFIGRSDWQLAETQFARSDAPESRTLAVLQAHGLVELVTGEVDMGNGVTILPAPGESPGHQVVQVQLPDRTLYVLGDLYHHEVEVEQPEWIVTWADAAGMKASRRALLPALLRDDSLLIAAHIAGVGRIEQMDGGFVWRKIGL